MFYVKIVAEGEEGLTKEKKEVLEALKDIQSADSKEYRALRARQNIMKQFKNIPMEHGVVRFVTCIQK